MHYYEVAPNYIARANSQHFTYSSDNRLQIGQIVLIEIGKKKSIGIVLKKTIKPTFKTKSVSLIIEKKPIPKELVELAIWMSEYYATPLGTVLQSVLPRGLQKNRKPKTNHKDKFKRKRTNIVFNVEQSAALKKLKNTQTGTLLLQGVTGSGKTELYINIAKDELLKNKSVIVLVPEIALTSQLISEFSNHFDNLLLTHSQMSESERHLVWKKALGSMTPQIMVGPRSALFMPLKNIGAIIVDEAHEPSYKQEKAPRYSALRAATMLGRFHNAKVVFGSATPNITDRFLAEQSNSPILELTSVARKDSIKPVVRLVDMRKHSNFNNHRFLSKELLNQINTTLDNKKQILIFHNRRGSANTTLCEHCGWTANCPSCFLPLSLHSDNHRLHCHVCGYDTSVPTSCPVCEAADIIHKGIGTKLIEFELKKLFPSATVARFDADNDNSETVNNRYQELYDGTIDIAIGTQVVAKGLDLPNLRTVGVIQADTGLALPDFNANERTFQLLAQVIGRVGRNEHKTQVIIQSYKPEHASVAYGLNQDYESFYLKTLKERKKALFPPYTYLLKLTCVYKTEAAAIKNSQKLAADLKSKLNQSVVILGPTPAFYERRHGTYRWQLVLKSPKRKYLLDAIKNLPLKSWQYELDPTSLL